MKSKKYALLVILLVVALALPTATASAKNNPIYFTFSEFCDETTIDIGRTLVVGQNNVIFKSWKQTCYESSETPQLNGVLKMDINMNSVGNGVWFFVGHGRLETADGAWDVNCIYPWPSDDAQCVGKGEGAYEGQQIFFQGYPGWQWAGYIVDRQE
jgi:hypothetical protein